MPKEVVISSAQFRELDKSIDAVRGAVNKVAEAIAPVEDQESISHKLAGIAELITNKEVVVVIDLNPLVTAIEAGFTSVTEAIAQLKPLPSPEPQIFRFEGGGFMRTYKGDRPPETIVFRKPTVVDSEGTLVDPQPELNYTITSDKTDIVSLSSTDNGDGTVSVSVSYGTPKKLEDGSYDIAEVRAESNTIDTPSGPIKDVVTEQIQLVPGDAAGFGTGGSFEFPEA